VGLGALFLNAGFQKKKSEEDLETFPANAVAGLIIRGVAGLWGDLVPTA